MTQRKRANGWLQLRIEGPPGNRQAIGVPVVLSLGDGRRVRAIVGQADSSWMSQGHYRLYFGLGSNFGQGAKVAVDWGAGHRSEYTVPANNDIMLIEAAGE